MMVTFIFSLFICACLPGLFACIVCQILARVEIEHVETGCSYIYKFDYISILQRSFTASTQRSLDRVFSTCEFLGHTGPLPKFRRRSVRAWPLFRNFQSYWVSINTMIPTRTSILLVPALALLPANSMIIRMRPPSQQESGKSTKLRPQEPKKPYPYIEREVSFE